MFDEIVILVMRRSGNKQKVVERQWRKQQCLVKGCCEPMHRQGRCKKCWNRFEHRMRSQTTATKRRKYLVEKAEDGVVLMPQECRELARKFEPAEVAG